MVDFRLRSVFGDTFAILARNLIPLAIISLPMTALYEFGVRAIAVALGVAPELVTSFDTERAFKVAFPPRGSETDPATVLAALIAVPAVYYVTVQVATLAISFATFRHIAGRPSDPFANLAFGLVRLVPALGVIAAVMIFSSAAAAVAWFVFFILLMLASQLGFETQVWLLLPLVLFLSAAIWIGRILRDWAAVPAFVLEGLGVFESLKRSAVLTRGRRGKIMRLYAIVLILGWLLAKIVGDVIGTALMTAFGAVFVSVVYSRLRAEKEGLVPADIAHELDRMEAGLSPKSRVPRKRAPPVRESVVVRTLRERRAGGPRRTLRRVLAGVGVFLLLFLGAVGFGLVNFDRYADYGPRPTDDYPTVKWAKWEARPGCGYRRPPELVAKLANDWHLYETGGGGDTVWVNQPLDLMIFDSASPQALEDHDTLILPGAPIANFSFERVGPHLRICAPTYLLSIVLARQYCHGGEGGSAWNNQIEEITFTEERETWLADRASTTPSRLASRSPLSPAFVSSMRSRTRPKRPRSTGGSVPSGTSCREAGSPLDGRHDLDKNADDIIVQLH